MLWGMARMGLRAAGRAGGRPAPHKARPNPVAAIVVLGILIACSVKWPAFGGFMIGMAIVTGVCVRCAVNSKRAPKRDPLDGLMKKYEARP
jgi:hypothetical protein